MNLAEFIEKNGSVLEKEAGAHVFAQGDEGKHLYFVREGLLKAYYLALDGKEHVKSFIVKGDVIGSLSAVYAEDVCSYSLVCLEPCELIRFPFSTLHEQTLRDLELAKAMNELLIKLAMKKERREFELLCLSAEDRYLLLKEQAPEILEKTTQENIARYLGITPVALSRIKKRVGAG